MRFIALLALLPWYAWGIALNSTQDADAAFSVAFDTAVDPIRRVSFTANFGTNDPLKRGEAFSVTLYDGNGVEIGTGAYENTSPGTVLGCACIDIDGTVNTSSMTARISNTVGTQELSSVTVEVAGRLNTERKTATLSVYTEPVDPNDPVDPPPTPGDYPEPVSGYTASQYFPTLGSYSVAGVCEAVHGPSATTVTLADGETLDSAWTRLRNTAGFSAATGGKIIVPWDVDTVQCDNISKNETKVKNLKKLTISGTVGPNGELPRFYCRWDRYEGGTIPNNVGYYFSAMITPPSSNQTEYQFVYENIEVDGYNGAFKQGMSGTFVYRNLYAHSGPDDGFINDGQASDFMSDYNAGLIDVWNKFDPTTRLTVEMCGVEVERYGAGNFKHNTYFHAIIGGGGDEAAWAALGLYDSYFKVVVVDSRIHTANYGSAFKSIANEHILKNNTFAQVLRTDPGYLSAEFPIGRRTSTRIIDIPACSKNEIIGNEFIAWSGNPIVGLRNRRKPHRGCDKPLMYTPGEPKGLDYPVKVYPNGDEHTEAFWTNLNNEQFMLTVVTDNVFRPSTDPESDFVDGVDWEGKVTNPTMKPMENLGTYPMFEASFGGANCWLETPSTWYERSLAYMNNNTYTDTSVSDNYLTGANAHNANGTCPAGFETAPPGPGVADPNDLTNYYWIGTNEVYDGTPLDPNDVTGYEPYSYP